MSRWEFMRKLEELLSDISPNEREEALQYYNDYFNDAGRENEQEVIRALGSPEQVAEIVKDGLGESGSQGEFTENGFIRGRSSVENELIRKGASAENISKDTDAGSGKEKYQGSSGGENARFWNAQSYDSGKDSEEGYTGADTGTYHRDTYAGSHREETGSAGTSLEKKKEMSVWEILLIIIGIIFLSPVILAAAGSVFAAIVSILAGAAGIVLGIGIAVVVLFVVAIALLIAGFSCMLTYPVTAIGLLGGACICGALGIVFMLALVFLGGKCIPAICRWLPKLWHSIVKKGKEIVA